jgi:hypothetical protein
MTDRKFSEIEAIAARKIFRPKIGVNRARTRLAVTRS